MYKVLIMMLLVTVGGACSNEKKEISKTEVSASESPTPNEYPDILLKRSDGVEMSAKDLKGNNLFILFQPDCDHCQEEAIQIEQHLDSFKDYTLYFISSASLEQISAFARDYKLNEKPNVHFAWTATQGVLDFYGPIPTPSVYVYSNGRLKRSFNGQTDIETIITAL